MDSSSGANGGVRSVTRALSLLSAVARGPKTLTALAGHSGVSLSTASRLLGTLKATGYVSQDTDGAYIPGPELTAMISATDLWAGIRSIAADTVRDLHARADETSAFFVRAGDDRLCIESAESSKLVRRVCLPGERGPVYLGAAGKALLAFNNAENQPVGLPAGTDGFALSGGQYRSLDALRAECAEVRARGYAYSARESTNESWSVAAPVYRQRTLVGVLSVVVPLTRSDEDYVQRLIQLTCEVATDRSG
ncbi:IclR family transcriptional regulator [Saccharopolyspora sp. ASAGF58]|uniref:IclR family transcriptional regulator n=1 Tax=Saccharopolyspora TaxID=1835 RepID=UPI0014400022|nr:IclR family transcriptional regulator [Saccharopolyspora sp. ASAGF58]QIZ36868.1 IclR family transcriptional regulator [Saccharopolyspora sp. ASAGF58]